MSNQTLSDKPKVIKNIHVKLDEETFRKLNIALAERALTKQQFFELHVANLIQESERALNFKVS